MSQYVKSPGARIYTGGGVLKESMGDFAPHGIHDHSKCVSGPCSGNPPGPLVPVKACCPQCAEGKPCASLGGFDVMGIPALYLALGAGALWYFLKKR